MQVIRHIHSAIGLSLLFFLATPPFLLTQETSNYIDIFYEGAPAPGMHETEKEIFGYRELAARNLISIFYARGPTGFGGEPEDVAWLARNGIDILYQLWFWHEHDYNIWDVYYN